MLDVTEQKASEAALRIANEFNATVVHSSPAFFVAIGANGRVRMMNEAMLRALDYEAQDVIGRDYISSFVPDADHEQLRQHFARLCEQREATLNTNRVVTRSGATLTVEWRGVPIFNAEGFEYFIGVGIDVTERERAEAELSRYRARLEELVAARTAELQQALDRLMRTQASLVQSEKLAALGALVAGVAHELNTPIGNGLTAASTIEHESRLFGERMQLGLKRSDLETYVGVMAEGSRLARSSLQRAADLVGSFKQVAVDQIGSQRRVFDLRQMLQDTLQTLTPALKQTPYSLSFDADAGVEMDSFPGPLGQVIGSLFQNALLHGLEGRTEGQIKLGARRQGDMALIEFSDDGAGIPAEHLRRIFDPFFTTKLGRGGSGLGLHIAHNIATSVLGGEISVRSAPDAGCTFSLRLPLAAPGPATPTA